MTARERWTVLAVKQNGVAVVFGVYRKEEAFRVAAQLVAIKCPAVAVPSRRGDMPGTTRHRIVVENREESSTP